MFPCLSLQITVFPYISADHRGNCLGNAGFFRYHQHSFCHILKLPGNSDCLPCFPAAPFRCTADIKQNTAILTPYFTYVSSAYSICLSVSLTLLSFWLLGVN